MDPTMLAVLGTGLTAIGTGVALFAALWKVQGNRFDTLERHLDKRFESVGERFESVDKRFDAVDKRFDAVDKRFDAVDKQFESVDKRFDAADKQFESADKRWTERFEMAERASRDRFEMAETASRERLEAMDRRWTERFEGMDRRIETAEQHNEAAHAAICQSIAKLDARTRADGAALHQRFDALNGRFDDLYRHLLGPAAQTGQPGPAPAPG